jgi:formylglycine-generating enzyme required for sulfatase activity
MGVVYQAVQTLMDRPVALKVINPAVLAHPDALPRFHAEVKAAAKLDHPNIVRAYDAEQVGDLHLLVMEYVEGQSLEQVVQRHGPLPAAEACRCVHLALLGLQHAFKQGMTHRDLKPQNLMRTPKGQVKVLDFGLARVRGEGSRGKPGLTAVGSFMGTPEYVAPEQATDARAADTRADVYSLGCTLYFLLTGRPPFVEGTPVKVVLAHLEKEPRPLHEVRRDVPVELAAVVGKMLAKDPAQRYQTPLEAAQALARFGKGGRKAAPPPLPATVGGSADRGTVLPVETRRVPGPPPVGAEKVKSPLAALTDSPSPQMAKGNGAGKGEAAWWRPVLLAGVGTVVLVLGVWLLAAVVLKARVKTSYGKARIELDVDQPGAEVFVDGERVRVSEPGDPQPLEIGVAAGKHVLEVKKAGFRDYASAVEVAGGNALPIKVRLEEREKRPRPDLLDCTSPGGVSAAEVRRMQDVWAKYLGRQVEETVEVAAGVTMAFVLVPPGKFRMGSPKDEKEREGEEALRVVTLTEPFYLGRTEVTQAQYHALGLENPSKFKGDDLPVEQVSWDEAREWAEMLTKKRGEHDNYRLPTEAEWEYACRGGRPSSQPFGIGNGRALSSRQANFNGNFPYGGAPKGPNRQATCAVALHPPNAFGLYEMHGNVSEWCADWFGPYPPGAATNPIGPSGEGAKRVIRGGSWSYQGKNCRAARRTAVEPGTRLNTLGFRLAHSVSSGDAR